MIDGLQIAFEPLVPLALLIALTVFAGPAMRYAQATAAQLYAPQGYIDAVLKKEAGS